jgi:hypothetical protein
MGKTEDSSSEEEKPVPVKGPKSTLRKKRRNKPKDYPKRPLSAYNVFFKETREHILADRKAKGEVKLDHKLDFQTMAKEIAARWKSLEKGERERVEKLAKKDMLRYREEVKLYEEALVKKNRAEREAAAFHAAKEEEENRAAAAAENARLAAERKEKQEEALRNGAAHAPASGLDALSALAGRFQGGGADESALQEALYLHQQREMIQRHLLMEELRAAEEREYQLRRLQSLGLLQGDGLQGLQAHQLQGLFGGGGGGMSPHIAALLQDHSGRGGAGGLGQGGLGAYGLGGGGHSLLSGAGGFSPELLMSGGAGQLQDAHQLQQQGLLQEHYARLLGGGGAGGLGKDAAGP